MTRLKKKFRDKLSSALSGIDSKFVNRDELDATENIRELDNLIDYNIPGDSLSFGNLHIKKHYKNYKSLR